MWRRTTRILLALAISPLAAIAAVALHVVLASQFFGGGEAAIRANLELFGSYSLVVAYPATLFLGLPLHLILTRFTSGTVGMHALVGAGLAFLIGLFLFDFIGGVIRQEWTLFATYALLVILPGSFVAATFAFIAGPPRSERNTPFPQVSC